MQKALLFAAFVLPLSTLLVLSQSSNAGGQERIPNSVEQGKVDRPLREKYKAEFASRDAQVRGDLSHKLRESADTENDTIAKFVLLREARELAVDAGDFSYSLDVIDDMARTYPIEVAEMKATALAAGVDRARLPRLDLARNYLKVADESIAVWDLNMALKAAYLAEKESAGNRELMDQAKARDKLARVRSHEVTAANVAMQKLANNADDPEQNQILGRHICFNTNHWDIGLPYLAKSANLALKAMAERELANPADAATMASLAAAWWDFNDPKANMPAGAAHRRAAFWYAKALPDLTGGTKAEAEKRIADAMAERTKP